MNTFSIEGRIVDVIKKEIYEGVIQIENGIITNVVRKKVDDKHYLVPGLIDAHIHIESSMLVPSEFAKIAVVHGTVGTVSDPHEIANVMGIEGVNYMIENSNTVPFKFYFGAPSCVPATSFESSGAEIGAIETESLLQRNEIKYLSEMMNYPGVLLGDSEVMGKIAAAKKFNKPVDGHAPGLKGAEAKKYIASGISTDHECFTLEEALEKIKYGMKVQIREGSAAKNFDALIPLMDKHSDKIMFCSDDKHPDDLLEGHMDQIVRRAIAAGYDPLDVIRVCTLNPKKHYKLDTGLLQIGDPADFIIVNNLEDFKVEKTYINGVKVAENGESSLNPKPAKAINKFETSQIIIDDLEVDAASDHIQVIKALDGQLITQSYSAIAMIENDKVVCDIERDILKIVVMNRYQLSKPSIAFINGFGLKKGAIASTVAHDSHNIIAVGTNDKDMLSAINMLIESKGGIALANGSKQLILPLPIGGIMSTQNGRDVALKYQQIDLATKKLGSALHAPFMTLSFMALLVIPELKLSDKGLFDGKHFKFTSLFVN